MTTDAPAEVGFRNQLRARWRQLPTRTRVGISMAVLVAFAILVFFTDHSLAYGVLLGGAVYWLRRLPDQRQRSAAMGAIVGLLAVLAIVGSTPWSLVLLLGARLRGRGDPGPAPLARAAGRSRRGRRSCTRSTTRTCSRCRSSARGPTWRRASTCSSSS